MLPASVECDKLMRCVTSDVGRTHRLIQYVNRCGEFDGAEGVVPTSLREWTT